MKKAEPAARRNETTTNGNEHPENEETVDYIAAAEVPCYMPPASQIRR